jgi:hypothetical protein
MATLSWRGDLGVTSLANDLLNQIFLLLTGPSITPITQLLNSAPIAPHSMLHPEQVQ